MLSLEELQERFMRTLLARDLYRALRTYCIRPGAHLAYKEKAL